MKDYLRRYCLLVGDNEHNVGISRRYYARRRDAENAKNEMYHTSVKNGHPNRYSFTVIDTFLDITEPV